ncbi:hypothetical protein [Ensifer aridi]|uniref:hypothetical protein n=1 Tax=Ensifer aridi TaxID=1708715 RepID=UPI00358E6BB1
MATPKAAILRPGELKSNTRGAPPTPLGTRKGSTSVIKGITVFRFGVPIGLHKSNCEDWRDGSRRPAITQIYGVHCEFVPNDAASIRLKAPQRFINPLGIRVHFDHSPNAAHSEAVAFCGR